MRGGGVGMVTNPVVTECVCRVSEGSEVLLQVLCLEGQVACLQRAFGTAGRGAEWRRLAEWQNG